jgi:hypothetical protein
MTRCKGRRSAYGAMTVFMGPRYRSFGRETATQPGWALGRKIRCGEDAELESAQNGHGEGRRNRPVANDLDHRQAESIASPKA